MFKEVVKYGFDNEEVIMVEMTIEEMEKVRNETLKNLAKWLKSGFITKEEYDKDIKEMQVA